MKYCENFHLDTESDARIVIV